MVPQASAARAAARPELQAWKREPQARLLREAQRAEGSPVLVAPRAVALAVPQVRAVSRGVAWPERTQLARVLPAASADAQKPVERPGAAAPAVLTELLPLVSRTARASGSHPWRARYRRVTSAQPVRPAAAETPDVMVVMVVPQAQAKPQPAWGAPLQRAEVAPEVVAVAAQRAWAVRPSVRPPSRSQASVRCRNSPEPESAPLE